MFRLSGRVDYDLSRNSVMTVFFFFFVHIHLLTGTSFNSDGGAGGGSVGTGWFFGEDAGILPD